MSTIPTPTTQHETFPAGTRVILPDGVHGLVVEQPTWNMETDKRAVQTNDDERVWVYSVDQLVIVPEVK